MVKDTEDQGQHQAAEGRHLFANPPLPIDTPDGHSLHANLDIVPQDINITQDNGQIDLGGGRNTQAAKGIQEFVKGGHRHIGNGHQNHGGDP